MIQEELRNFIEQNCSGKEPSDLIMEAIGQKIEQLGADADEVLAFVEECAKGPTLEKKAAEQKRKENERLAFIGHLEKRLAEVKSDDISLYNNIKFDLEAEIKKAKSVYSSDSQIQKILSALEEEKAIADEKLNRHNRNKKLLRYALLLLLFAVIIVVYSLFSGKMTISAKPQTTNDSLIDIRKKFYSCETWEKQLQYVMEPERVKPLMEDYYKKEVYSASEENDIGGLKIKRLQGKKYILYNLNSTYLVKTDDGYKIDWEATVRYNPLSLVEMRDYPDKEFEYRDRMVFESGRNNIHAYNISDKSGYGLAHAEENSKIDKRLDELMPYRSAEAKDMILKIQYWFDNDGEYWYKITDIISENCSKY
jgi:hypothetical protein